MTEALNRPNLFRVNIDFPNQVKRVRSGQGLQSGGYSNGVTKLAEFTVRAAQLPSTNMGVVEVPYRGRTLKIAGDRSFVVDYYCSERSGHGTEICI